MVKAKTVLQFRWLRKKLWRADAVNSFGAGESGKLMVF
jgi:hypothetical protein